MKIKDIRIIGSDIGWGDVVILIVFILAILKDKLVATIGLGMLLFINRLISHKSSDN